MEEFSRPALALIRDTLAPLTGLSSLVIALAAENAEDVAAAEPMAPQSESCSSRSELSISM
jgi:hypothetical protein